MKFLIIFFVLITSIYSFADDCLCSTSWSLDDSSSVKYYANYLSEEQVQDYNSESISCSSNSSKSVVTLRVVSVIDSGSFFHALIEETKEIFSCKVCEDNEIYYNNSCVECPANSTKTENNTCECDDGNPPDAMGVCTAPCPEGKYLNPMTKVCEDADCPYGSHPSPTYADDSTCIKDDCPDTMVCVGTMGDGSDGYFTNLYEVSDCNGVQYTETTLEESFSCMDNNTTTTDSDTTTTTTDSDTTTTDSDTTTTTTDSGTTTTTTDSDTTTTTTDPDNTNTSTDSDTTTTTTEPDITQGNTDNSSIDDALSDIFEQMKTDSNNTKSLLEDLNDTLNKSADVNETNNQKGALKDIDTQLSDALASFDQTRSDITSLANGLQPPRMSASGGCSISTQTKNMGTIKMDFSHIYTFRPYVQFVLNLALFIMSMKFYFMLFRDIVGYFVNGL